MEGGGVGVLMAEGVRRGKKELSPLDLEVENKKYHSTEKFGGWGPLWTASLFSTTLSEVMFPH